jgi:signal transduction histidine kinase
MKISELRHLDGVKGNFGICDKEEYLAAPTIMETQPAPQLIYSNIKEVIEQQQYVFDSFWSKSISSEQKIREIEEGVVLGNTELVLVPLRIQELFIDLVKSAKQEILLILPTTNAFLREYKLGIIQSLKQESVSEPNINVRILTPTNNTIEEMLKNITSTTTVDEQKKENENFVIRRIDLANEIAVSTVTIAVADRKISLVIEKKDDSKEYFIDAVGLATYSTSKPTVSSYVSIFENLWAQTELYHQLKVSNQQIALANEQLKIHDRMQKEFINVAAHELRTPIQPILGLTQVMRSMLADRKEESELLNVISRNAMRLHQLTENILDVTKIESNSLQLNKEPFNLSEMISNAMSDFKSQLKEYDNVRLELLSNEEDAIFVQADKSRIGQVISNLLNNAIKFTQQRKCQEYTNISITLNKHADKDNNKKEVVITIKDRGIGIAPDIMARLFTKFATKSYQGTGLGLFISKSIVEAHGGRIWAINNTRGKGATFTFTLPITRRYYYHHYELNRRL